MNSDWGTSPNGYIDAHTHCCQLGLQTKPLGCGKIVLPFRLVVVNCGINSTESYHLIVYKILILVASYNLCD